MATIFRVDTYAKERHFIWSLIAQEGDKDFVDLALREGRENKIVLTVRVDMNTGQWTVVPFDLVASTTNCIAGCGVSSFVSPIMKCWKTTKKSANRKKDFIACLKGKGINVASNFIGCMVGCLSTIPNV